MQPKFRKKLIQEDSYHQFPDIIINNKQFYTQLNKPLPSKKCAMVIKCFRTFENIFMGIFEETYIYPYQTKSAIISQICR